MPQYDFICDQCKKEFTLTMSISDHAKRDMECPACKSKKVTQQVTTFQTKTSKKS